MSFICDLMRRVKRPRPSDRERTPNLHIVDSRIEEERAAYFWIFRSDRENACSSIAERSDSLDSRDQRLVGQNDNLAGQKRFCLCVKINVRKCSENKYTHDK